MAESPVRVLDRYAMYESFAGGGMAVVHYGRVLGAVGFSRLVAIKKLHPHFSRDPEFVAMFLDEARLASRVQHSNVVQTLDAVSSQGELFVILEYIHGESLSLLMRAAGEEEETPTPPPPSIAAAIFFGVLEGLHAAHEARDSKGEPLELVHRDVSPQNVLVGADGVARVLDFGIAKARGRSQVTRDGAVKGKLAYMAPEQILGKASRRSDVFAASVCLWEALTARRLFAADDEGTVFAKVMNEQIESPAVHVPDLPPALVAVVMRGLERNATARFSTAREMAMALQESTPLATPIEVGAWVSRLAGTMLDGRAARVASIEHASGDVPPAPSLGRTSHPAPLPASLSAAPSARARGRDPFATVPEPMSGVSSVAVFAPGGAALPVAGPADLPELPDLADTMMEASPPSDRFPGLSLAASTSSSGARGRDAVSARRWRLLALALVAATGLVGALALRIAMHASPPVAAAVVVDTPMTKMAASSQEAQPGIAISPLDGTSDAGVASLAAGSSSGSASSLSPPAARLTRYRGAKKSGCSPAYTVDDQGLRRYKPECF